MHRSKKVNRKAKKSPKRKRSGLTALSRIHPQVAGIDLGSREHWVCAPEVSKGTPNVRTFGTTMPQLQQLAEWLLEQGVESVAMESTNVYWIPLYELLESCGIEVLLVNARQLRHVPGRKTDMRDCQWIQLLHSCGLLRGSFRPPRDHRRNPGPAPAIEQSGEGEQPLCAVDAEVAGSDERPDPSCGHRSDRSDGDGDGAGDCGRREGPSPSGGPARRAVQEIQRGVCRVPVGQLAGGASVQPQVGAGVLRHDSTRDRGL